MVKYIFWYTSCTIQSVADHNKIYSEMIRRTPLSLSLSFSLSLPPFVSHTYRITNSPIADVFIVWAKCQDGKIRGFILEKVSLPHHTSSKHLWRNRLARSAVNRKVAGSSPARCELIFFSSSVWEISYHFSSNVNFYARQ